ncbi:MAG TPA: CpaD family pilus assembly lipoprotein [Alphaproteobacteria bacterium]|nr:hypothetical protein [Alphaproteobacteria bacterium]USO05769.1 MAG: hypothetical protein H6859_00760 [Rhodospirillales bacterium]HOO81443.1 CpaD family pilus assembly lipoprotein [Alphaproteobacteria bacterium]
MSVRTSKKHRWTVSLPYTILGMITLAMVLSGCLSEPTMLNQNRVQVQEETFTDTLPASELSGSAVQGLARHYDQHGGGPLELTVTYDPKSRSANAMHANDEAARIVKELRAAGVHSVDANILPVNGSGGMNAMVSYTAYNALAPKDCSTIPGFEDLDVKVDEDYRLGCTTETLFARQVARPKDLKGQGTVDPITDGRRMSNTVAVYRMGVPNEPLDGESASE